MRPLGELICHHMVKYYYYADDTQLYFSTPGKLRDVMAILSQCLEAVRVWMGSSRFQLNPSKTEWLWFIDMWDYLPFHS